MARPREFDELQALDRALDVFREHGFEGTSAAMLTKSMGIGKQSLYDTFGDKWELYLAAVKRYADTEVAAHLAALDSRPGALQGIQAMLDRVVSGARMACLGINSICEFGTRHTDLNAIQASAERRLRAALIKRIREAQVAGEISSELDPDSVVEFLVASFTGIRIAARAGAQDNQITHLGHMALRALR